MTFVHNDMLTHIRESFCSSVSMSWKAIRLKKSTSGRLKSGKALVLHVSEEVLFFCFRVLPGINTNLIRWENKASLLPYIRIYIYAKNYQNCFMFVEIVANQMWDVFLKHSIL